MVDPTNTYIDATVTLASDVTLFPGTILQGACTIGAGTEIGPNTRLVDCAVGTGAVIEFSVARNCTIGDDVHMGPFAAPEPGTTVPAGARLGAF
jgi:bifunctional UDP-N-acetylglucosamine pyrophosphorylase/glucosamine-1-phosphate N-acetyltransferase